MARRAGIALIRLLLVSGSLRAGSTNSAVVRTAREVARSADIDAVLYEGMADLPHFNPDDDEEGAELDPAVTTLRAELDAAEALLICTPEYAGALPGALKNLLEWTVGGGQTYDMSVAWINAAGSAAPSGAADAHDSLRKVLGYTGSRIVEAACVRIPVTRGDLGADGLIADPEIRAAIGKALRALVRGG